MAAWKLMHFLAKAGVLHQGTDVDALRGRDGAIAIANGDDLDAAQGQLLTDHGTHVAEALDDSRGSCGIDVDLLQGLHDTIDNTPASCLTPAHAASQLHRLAGHNLRA